MVKYLFEWDPDKDAINQQRHGVAFIDAQEAFYNTNRIIIQDEQHSESEGTIVLYRKNPHWHSHRTLHNARSKHPHYWSRLLEKMEKVL